MKWIKAAFLIFCLSGITSAFASGQYLVLHYHIGLHKALLEGNIAHLEKESKNAKYEVLRKVAHMAYLQAQMRLPELQIESTECFQSKTNRTKAPLLAISCSVFASEAAYYDQHISEWARLTVAAKQYDYPKLKELAGRNYKIRFFHYFDEKHFLKVPRISVKRGKGSSLSPWVQCGVNVGNVAKVWAQVDNTKVCFVIDTGASISILTQKTAKKLGLVLYKGRYGFGSSRIAGNPKVTHYAQLAVAQSVKIGHDVLHNIPFSVYNGTFNIIGTDTQRQLGRLLFTKSGLEIRSVSKNTCTEPMAYAYHYGVPRGPVLGIVINGKSMRLMFDSGQTTALFTNARKNMGPSRLSTMKTAYLHGEYGETEKAYITDVSIAQNLKSKTVMVPIEYAPGYSDAIPLKAGFDLLKKYSVELNFDAHTACFLPAG